MTPGRRGVEVPMERLACPRCGRERTPELVECPACGVIFARFRPRAGYVAAASAPASPVPDRAGLRPARLERLLLALAQALESGLSLPTLAAGPGFSDLPARLREPLRAGIASGEPLSALLAAVLDPPSTALLRAAEERGGVPAALRLVAARIAERRRDRLKLLLSLAHPALVVLAAAVFLPLPLLFRGDFAGYAARALPLAGAVVAATAGILLAGVALPPGSPLDRLLSWFALWFPPTRAVRLRSSIATFAGLLGEAIRAGLPVRAAAPLAASAVDHPAVAAVGRAIPARLDAGETLTDALAPLPGLSRDALALIDAGERSGRLDESLAHVARDARSKARLIALALHGALSLLLGLLVAAAVAYAVITAWTDYFGETRRLLDGLR